MKRCTDSFIVSQSFHILKFCILLIINSYEHVFSQSFKVSYRYRNIELLLLLYYIHYTVKRQKVETLKLWRLNPYWACITSVSPLETFLKLCNF